MSSAHALDELETFDAPDLPTIDLAAGDPGDALTVVPDRRTYEERFAELGFGLGVVPRKLRRDDAWWETPAGLLVAISVVLFLLWLQRVRALSRARVRSEAPLDVVRPTIAERGPSGRRRSRVSGRQAGMQAPPSTQSTCPVTSLASSDAK